MLDRTRGTLQLLASIDLQAIEARYQAFIYEAEEQQRQREAAQRAEEESRRLEEEAKRAEEERLRAEAEQARAEAKARARQEQEEREAEMASKKASWLDFNAPSAPPISDLGGS